MPPYNRNQDRFPKRPDGSIDNHKKIRNPLAPAQVLSAQQWRFVEEYFITMDLRRSLEAAGLPAGAGSRLLTNPTVQRALAQARAFRSSRTAVYADEQLRRWWLLATADVNELVELRIINCRYCNGFENQYQFTKDEMRRKEQAHKKEQLELREDKRVPFDYLGGDGYDWNAPPNLDCTECSGNGIPHPVFKDTRYLTGGGRLLYDGIEITSGGFKLKMRDRGFAEHMVARHLGMFNDKEPVRTFDPVRMTDEELNAVIDNIPPHIRTKIEQLFGQTMSVDAGEDELPIIDQG